MKMKCRIKNFPVSYFSVILGMVGFTIAWQKAEIILKLPIVISQYLLILSLILFLIISIIYLIKILKFVKEVVIEFNNPIKLNFFPTFSISLLLLSIAFLEVNLLASKYFLISGVIIHFIFTLKIIAIWMHHDKFEIKHMNPAWFIPAVGNILIPVSGAVHMPLEISWFFYSLGLFFWIILLIIFFNRIIFHHPLPDKLLPTLFILIAPPAVGFIAYVKLINEVNDFSKMLYYISLFLVILLLSQVKIFKQIKFYLSWWAYSFPVSAITIASLLMLHKTGIIGFEHISYVLFIGLNLVILVLLVKTFRAILGKEICIKED